MKHCYAFIFALFTAVFLPAATDAAPVKLAIVYFN